MKRLFSLAAALLVALTASVACAQKESTIAITEFMNDADGNDGGRDWIEFFNYGDKPVNLSGWQLSDDGGSDLLDVPDAIVPPGGYVVLVLDGGGRRMPANDQKELFELEWLGGKKDDRVLVTTGRAFHLSDGADQIVVRNLFRKMVWRIAWKGDGTPGLATFLADEDKFFRFDHGLKSKPGVVRNGNDNGDFLGYESHGPDDPKKDPLAWQSDVSKLEATFGELYKPKDKGGDCRPGFASPLKGHYKQK